MFYCLQVSEFVFFGGGAHHQAPDVISNGKGPFLPLASPWRPFISIHKPSFCNEIEYCVVWNLCPALPVNLQIEQEYDTQTALTIILVA